MASGLFDGFKSGMMNGVFNLGVGGHDIRLALMGVGYSFNATAHVNWTDISSYEITGTNYTAGGKTIPTLVAVSSHVAQFKTSADVTWAAATITAYGAIIYDYTVASKPLIAWSDFGGPQTSTSGNFTVSWINVSNIIITNT